MRSNRIRETVAMLATVAAFTGALVASHAAEDRLRAASTTVMPVNSAAEALSSMAEDITYWWNAETGALLRAAPMDAAVEEDDPAFDCRVHGNRVCGPGAFLPDGTAVAPGQYAPGVPFTFSS